MNKSTKEINDISIRGALIRLVKLEKNWFWRGIGLVVAAATVTSAIFQGLSYFGG